VRTRAHVTRLLFDSGGGLRASGAECRIGGALVAFKARREVIVSGGAINSPQLLQLSGIGDGAALQALGIASRVHAPQVGQGLQDHLCVSHLYKSKVRTLNDVLYPLRGKLWAGLRYLFSRRGPLAMSVNQAGAFVRSRPGLARPNLHLYFNPISYSSEEASPRRLRNPDPFSAFLISFNTCRPTSRGSVTIRSADPLDKPAIRTNFLSTEHDLRDVFDGARLLRRIAATRPLADFVVDEHLPGVQVQTDEQLLDDFRRRGGSVFHASCTCAMGPDPRQSVVDSRLRVHGVQGLRVIDASIFPSVTSGNTNAPTIMVAEKGADLVLQDWR
jgi:choline dehydrogenase